MSAAHLEIVAKGRSALLAGEVGREVPPNPQSGRWGPSFLLRPDSVMLDRLTEFAAATNAVAGGGHWAHGRELLHVSLRFLHPWTEHPTFDGYAEALADAASDLPPIRATVRTVSPHPLGVAVHVHPHGDTLDELYRRVAPALRRYTAHDAETWTRDIWYINTVHFASDVNVEALIDWCDERRDTVFGETTFDAVELVRYHYTGSGMRAETIQAVPLVP